MKIETCMAVGVVLAYGAVAFAETTAGWENVSPDRKEFPLARVVWAAPSESLRVEKADGAEGDVHFADGRIVIRKTNDRGVIRVIAPVAKFDGGRHVRFSADVLSCHARSVNGALGGLSASADGKSFPEYDKFRPERWFGNGGPSMRRMINTAPNTSYRKYTHGVSDSGEIVPAIYVRGAASESTWTNWRAEYNDEAQKLWAEHREKMRMPDRRPEMESEETFEKALAADTEHSAEIRTVGGRSVFCVDGQPAVPIVYKQSHMFDSPPHYLTYAGRPLHDAGVKVGVIEVHFAGRPDKCQPFWTKDGFDARGLAGRIREEMRIAGPQIFLLAVSLNAYPEFSASCPDEQWRKADGSVACGTFGSVSADYDSGGDYSANKKVWPWVSYASRTYRAAVRKNLTALIAELKRTGLAKRIVGFHLAGFHDGQFAMPFPDYSASAKAEYAAYCKDHPDANFDYFSVQLGFRTQEEFARHIKREFGKPMVGVRWCMTPFGGGSGAHDIVAFTHSDAIDVIVPQTAYMQREPGLATGCNLPIASFNENRKMLWYEFDHRNYSAIDTWGQSIIAQKGLAFAEDDVQWANIDRKHHGMMIALGMGNWYYDMGGGWFRQPGIVREVADVYRFREKLLAKTPDSWRPDVVWVIDEKSICLYNRPGQPKVSGVYRMVGGARETMGASGVPYETRLVEDFQRDPSLAKRYKAAVLAGFLHPDESRRKVMSDFAAAGVKTLVEQARGITSEELNAFASEAGAFVAAKPGLEVDMNGDFVSAHALWTDCWELRLPFACRVINVKSGAEEHPSGNVLKLNLTAGETCWFLLERVRRTACPHTCAESGEKAMMTLGNAISVPLRASAPAVDGVIGEEEWKESVALAGFLLTKPTACIAASGGEGIAHFACDGRSLFLAFRFAARNNDPGGGLAARASARDDGAVTEDDNIELLLKTDADPTQVYHIFTNPRDVVFDRLWPIGRKADATWNCAGLKVRSVIKAKIWECEMEIPLASIGNPQDRVLVNVARNTPGAGAARLLATSDYQGDFKLAVRWAKGAPAIHMLPLGKPLDGTWSTGVRIAAAEPGAKYGVSLAINTKYKPEVEGVRVAEKSGELGAGETLRLDYGSFTRNYLGYTARVTDAAGRVLFERSLLAKRGRQSKSIPMTGEYDLGDVATAVAYHYPGMDKARVTVFPVAGRKLESVRIVSAGKSVSADRQADGSFSALVGTVQEPGRFTLGVTVTADGKTRAFAEAIALEKKRCEWLGNDIGKEEVILPPFTPIAAKGDSFEVLLRKCRLNASALPVQVNALGRDILAGEAYYEIVEGGPRSRAAERFSGESPRIETRKDGYEATVRTAAKSAGGIVLRTDCKVEYDGFQKNTVALEGVSGRTVERLTLVIPFKDEEVPLWHICTADSIRFNPTGALPKGEGLLWDGTKLYRKSEFLDPMMEPQTVPYVWLGAERRGLSWCINSTCGFKLDAEKPSVRIVREKGVVRVEIDVINRPVRLKDGHAFEFAFEATPVKMPDRGLLRQFPAALGGAPEGFACRKNIDWITLGYFNMWAHGPADGNWDAYSAVCRRVKEGDAYPEFFADMTNGWERLEPKRKEYASTMQNMGKATYHSWMKSCWSGNVRYFGTIPAGSRSIEYSDPTLAWNRDSFVEEFKSEWISRGTGYIGAVRTFLVPSYMDYLLWYHREQLRHGLFGIYMDDMFPMTCRNPDTSMTRDDEGKWHGNLGIFEMRELVKRVSVLQHEMGLAPRLLQVHMTNCLLVPCFAFATSTLSWEDHYGEDEFQKRFAFDYIRAESLGTQVGCEAVALDGIYRGTWDEKDWRFGRFAFLTRTQLALLLPIGVKVSRRPQVPFAGYDAETLYPVYDVLGRFRIWEEGCRFVPCFEDDGAVSGAPEGVLVASWRRKGETLVVFGNLDGRDKEFAPKADDAALGLPSDARLFDAEGDDPIPDGRIRLAGWDFALVRYATSVPEPKGELQDLSVGWRTNSAYKADLVRFREKGLVVSPGDTVRFTVKAKGRGAWEAGIYQYLSVQKGEWRGAKMVRRIARSPKRMTTSVVEVVVGEDVTFIRPALAIRAGADITFGDVRIEVLKWE